MKLTLSLVAACAVLGVAAFLEHRRANEALERFESLSGQMEALRGQSETLREQRDAAERRELATLARPEWTDADEKALATLATRTTGELGAYWATLQTGGARHGFTESQIRRALEQRAHKRRVAN